MGLKESGLRGSLRSTSSVLPAFFDVTITNTNSPVQEGDILTVDYSADNTGDSQDTQDIRLEIDSVEEDRDSDITLLGAQSTTGTLEWDTTDEDEAEYTATVLSDDDSDSVIVEIEAAIPDSVVSRPDDDSTSTDDSEQGIVFTSDVRWTEIGFEVSSNTAGDFEEIRVHEVDMENGTHIQMIHSEPAPSLSGGEELILDLDNPIEGDGTEYALTLWSDGESEPMGHYDDGGFPHVSPDNNLSFIDGINADGASIPDDGFSNIDRALLAKRLGNVGFD